MEEAFIHEGAHTSLDPLHKISFGWRAAQINDPNFISTYAQEHPNREDFAESYLAYIAIRYRADRIPQTMIDNINQAIPNRIAYFDSLNLDISQLENKAQKTDQAWLVGTGTVNNKILNIDNVIITQGGVFGENFDAQLIERNHWGQISIEFTSCSSALLNYTYINSNAQTITSGYPLARIAPNQNQRNCEESGFEQTTDKNWVAGTWFGGVERSGEGILLDTLENGQVFFTWFTYGNSDK